MIMIGRSRVEAGATASQIGQDLARKQIHPDLVLCSTATRTRETWDRALRGGVQATEVRYVGTIYHGWVPELVRLLREIPDSVGTALMLGHAPGIPDLVEFLAERDHAFGGLGPDDGQVPDRGNGDLVLRRRVGRHRPVAGKAGVVRRPPGLRPAQPATGCRLPARWTRSAT